MDDGEVSNGFPHQNQTGASNNPPTLKRKRNLPGNPGNKLVLSFIYSLFSASMFSLFLYFLDLFFGIISIFKGNFFFY